MSEILQTVFRNSKILFYNFCDKLDFFSILIKLIKVDNSRNSALKWTSVQFYLKALGQEEKICNDFGSESFIQLIISKKLRQHSIQ